MNKYLRNSRTWLAVLGVLILLLIPCFVKTTYILHILIMTFYIGAAALSWNILGGMTGQVSLGHAAFMGLGAFFTGVLVSKFNISPWISMVLAFFVVGLVSVAIFYPCFILKGPYFTLATMAFAETFRNLFLNWDFTGKAQGILLPLGDDSFAMMRFAGKVPYYFIALGMFALIFFIVRTIDRSKLGYAFKTVREDEDTASAIGINTTKYKLIATFISTGLVAVCGCFYAQYISFIDPDIMSLSYSVEFVMPAIIGGVGTIGGAVLGAFILTPLSEFLRANLSSVLPGANLLVYAVVLILVVRLQPRGIMGWYGTSKLRGKVQHVYSSINEKLSGGVKNGNG